MDIDYTCPRCWEAHRPVPGYPGNCPRGRPRVPKPDRKPTEAEQRQAAIAEIALRDQIEARQRREAEAASAHAWALKLARLNEDLAAYRHAKAARREASAIEAHEVMIGVRRGQAWEDRV